MRFRLLIACLILVGCSSTKMYKYGAPADYRTHQFAATYGDTYTALVKFIHANDLMIATSDSSAGIIITEDWFSRMYVDTTINPSQRYPGDSRFGLPSIYIPETRHTRTYREVRNFKFKLTSLDSVNTQVEALIDFKWSNEDSTNVKRMDVEEEIARQYYEEAVFQEIERILGYMDIQ